MKLAHSLIKHIVEENLDIQPHHYHSDSTLYLAYDTVKCSYKIAQELEIEIRCYKKSKKFNNDLEDIIDG